MYSGLTIKLYFVHVWEYFIRLHDAGGDKILKTLLLAVQRSLVVPYTYDHEFESQVCQHHIVLVLHHREKRLASHKKLTRHVTALNRTHSLMNRYYMIQKLLMFILLINKCNLYKIGSALVWREKRTKKKSLESIYLQTVYKRVVNIFINIIFFYLSGLFNTKWRHCWQS